MLAPKALLGALAATLALAAPAAAQTDDEYPGATSTTAAPSETTQVAGTFAAGESATVESCGFRPGPVDMAVNGRRARTDTAEADGCARTTVAVLGADRVRIEGAEVAARCGENTLTVSGRRPDGGPRVVNSVFGIDCAAPAGTGLPRTGALVLRWSLAGGALVAVGCLVVLAARRRRGPTAG